MPASAGARCRDDPLVEGEEVAKQEGRPVECVIIPVTDQRVRLREGWVEHQPVGREQQDRQYQEACS